MVIDRDREDALGAILADDVLVELLIEAPRSGDLVGEELVLLRGGALFFDDLATQVDALVADIDASRPGDQPPDLLLALAAERAAIGEAGVPGVSRWSSLPNRRSGPDP
jgi:hypothetical protein